MTQIRINTTRAREVGKRLIAESNRVTEIGRELQNAISSLDTWAWEGVSRVRAESLLSQTQSASLQTSQGLEDLGHKLTRVADTFEHEDNMAAGNFVGMSWVNWDSKTAMQDERFIGGPALFDIQQGALGDCYLIAGMGAIAYLHPECIEQAIRKNEDGTYTVTFYDNDGNPVEITVTDDFPTSKSGRSFATSTQKGEEWVSLVEKAYVKWKTGGTETKDYEKIAGGDPGEIMRSLTGKSIDTLNIRKDSADEIGKNIQEALKEGNPVTVGIKPTTWQRLNNALDILIPDDWVDITHGDSQDLVGNHAYVVKSIDGDKVTLYNPWGIGLEKHPAEFTLSTSDLKKYASDIDICNM